MADQFFPGQYEDVEISGHSYRFFTKFSFPKMLNFKYDLNKIAKREIYSSMLDSGEIADPIGSAMVDTAMATSWVYQMGFNCPDIIEFLCSRLAIPLNDKSPSLLDSIYEAGEEGIAQLKLFFIKLMLPIPKIVSPMQNSENSSNEHGTEEKTP